MAGFPSQPVEKQSPDSRGSHADAEPRFSARLPLSPRYEVFYFLPEREQPSSTSTGQEGHAEASAPAAPRD